MANAKHEADRFGASEVTPEHILLALLLDTALTGSIKERFRVEEVRAVIEDHLPRLETNPLPHDLPLSVDGRKALLLATEEAGKLGHRYVENEHVLLAVAQSESTFVASLMRRYGFSPEEFRMQIKLSK